MYNEIFYGLLEPMIDLKMLGLLQIIWQELCRDGFYFTVKLDDVVPVIFRRATVQQKHSL